LHCRVFDDKTLPPLFFLIGHRASQLAKAATLGKRVRSGPISDSRLADTKTGVLKGFCDQHGESLLIDHAVSGVQGGESHPVFHKELENLIDDLPKDHQ
jgi:hypothetical protein